MEAYTYQQEYCADVGGGSTTTAAEALSEVTPVLARLSRTYDAQGESFLLYWRGVLLQCVQQDERAAEDFAAFLADQTAAKRFPTLVREAERRQLILSRRLAGPADEPWTVPAVTLGVGGGYQLTAAASAPHHFGTISVDLSIRLVGPLRLHVFGRPSFSGPLAYPSGVQKEPATYAALIVFGLGPGFRWEGPVRPGFAVLAQFAPTNNTDLDAPVLAGAAANGSVDIGFGRLPLALRLHAEVGFIGSWFLLRGGAQAVVAF